MLNNLSRRYNYDLDFDDYLAFLNKNMPNSLFLTDQNNKDLFLSINTAFKLSDILTDFEFVTKDKNYYNLLIEYKMYFARILSAVSLNDKFLIDNILRLLIEKLYRIITGLAYPARGERRVRSDSRERMSNDLVAMLNPLRKSELDILYSDLSNSIHHTNTRPEDLYSIRELFTNHSNLGLSTTNVTNQLTEIFVDEVFLKICLAKRELCGTSFSIKINNNLPPIQAKKILLSLGL